VSFLESTQNNQDYPKTSQIQNKKVLCQSERISKFHYQIMGKVIMFYKPKIYRRQKYDYYLKEDEVQNIKVWFVNIKLYNTTRLGNYFRRKKKIFLAKN
jgi:hypothetical protein